MATVAIVDGVHIRFYWNEHPPPHFHAVIAGEVAVIDIRSLAVIHGDLAAGKLRAIVKWAGHHRAELDAAWKAAQDKRKPDKIA